MFKNTAGTFLVYAFDSATGLPKSGDAANLTAYVKIDAGSLTVLADTSATEIDATNAKGYYLFDAAQAETNGDRLVISGKSSTSGIVVIGAPAVIFTRPQTGWLSTANLPTNFSSMSIDSSGRIDLGKWIGTAPLALSSQQVQAIVPDTQKVDVNLWKTESAPSLTVDGLLRCDTIEILGKSPTTSIADAVWDEAISGHLTSGTTGAKLNTAGSASDPLENAVPGSYAGGTAGHALGLLGAGSVDFAGSAVNDNDGFEITQGDAYLNSDGLAFSWTFGASPSLSGATVVLRIQGPGANVTQITCAVTGAGTGTQVVKADITAAQSLSFDPGNYSFDIQATLASLSPVTLLREAGMNVKPQVTT